MVNYSVSFLLSVSIYKNQILSKNLSLLDKGKIPREEGFLGERQSTRKRGLVFFWGDDLKWMEVYYKGFLAHRCE